MTVASKHLVHVLCACVHNGDYGSLRLSLFVCSPPHDTVLESGGSTLFREDTVAVSNGLTLQAEAAAIVCVAL